MSTILYKNKNIFTKIQLNLKLLIHKAKSKNIGQKLKKLKKYAKTFDTAGGGDILNSEKQNASFAIKLWLSTIL